MATPLRFFCFFFLDDKTSPPDVCCNGSFIPRAHFETSLVVVSYYGYEIWRHKCKVVKQFLSENACFSTFFNNKSKTCGCVVLQVKGKKIILILSVSISWFLILNKIQDGEHVGDVTDLQQRHHPIKYTWSCREDQRLSNEGKIVSKYCNISKTRGGVRQPPLVPRWGYDFACTLHVWGLRELQLSPH